MIKNGVNGSSRQQQRGMAMLMALLLVALASALATSLWYGTSADLARINYVKQQLQAKHLAQGLMLWASDVLRQDYENDDTPSDGSQDGWLQGIQNMPVENAMVSGRLAGMNHCFNVNNLWRDGQVSEVHHDYLIRLLQLMELDLAIADQLIDWQDSDQLPRPQGAEDASYMGRSPSYQTASGPFLHQKQLGLLGAVTPDIHQALKAYLCVLPNRGGPTRMNINTMPPLMIRALHTSITPPVANSIYQDGQAHFNRLDDFFQKGEIQILSNQSGFKERMAQLIGTQTTHIEAQSSVQMNNSLQISYALLQRGNDGAAIILQRSQSPFLDDNQLN